MNIKACLTIIFLFLSTSAISYAGYRSSCLDICFETRHDCQYCAYQCYSEDRYVIERDYSEYSTCPLYIESGLKRY